MEEVVIRNRMLVPCVGTEEGKISDRPNTQEPGTRNMKQKRSPCTTIWFFSPANGQGKKTQDAVVGREVMVVLSWSSFHGFVIYSLAGGSQGP